MRTGPDHESAGRRGTGRRGRRRAALLALGLAALALRPQLTGIGPLLPEIQADLGVSHVVAGLLPAIPIVCMGLFAPPAAYVSGLLGARAGGGLPQAAPAGPGPQAPAPHAASGLRGQQQ